MKAKSDANDDDDEDGDDADGVDDDDDMTTKECDVSTVESIHQCLIRQLETLINTCSTRK